MTLYVSYFVVTCGIFPNDESNRRKCVIPKSALTGSWVGPPIMIDLSFEESRRKYKLHLRLLETSNSDDATKQDAASSVAYESGVTQLSND